MRIIYGLFSLIDWVVYWIASNLFQVIFHIKDVDFFGDQIQEFANHVYVVVGVLMLFKLVISAIQYLLNPDSFDDKEKGLAGLLKRMVISVLLIAVIPSVFEIALDIQTDIVETLPSIILGSSASTVSDKETVGKKVSYTVLASFIKKQDGNPVGGYGINDEEIHDLDTFLAHAAGGCPWLFGDTKDCNYNYMVIVSTICGGFMCYVLLSMALDVAIRTIKLGIIQMLAPIPVSSYIFSKDKLSKFFKTALQVYADLFIRFAIIYLVIFAIQSLIGGAINPWGKNSVDTGSWFFDAIVTMVLILGLLMFAKSAPKFITDLLGLPEVTGGNMADMFKPAWTRAGGAAGQLINPAANAVANWRQARGMGRGIGESLRRAAGGFGRGALDSVQGMMAGDDWTKMRQRHDAAKKRSLERATTARNRENNEANGNTRLQNVRDQIAKLRERVKLKNDPTVATEAESRYSSAQTRLQKMGDAIQRGIDNGTLTGEKREKALAKYAELSTQLGNKENWIDNEKTKIAAEREQQATVAKANTRIAEIDSKIAGGVSTDERMKLETEKSNLQKSIENITHANARAKNQTNISDARTRVSEIDAVLAGGSGDATLDGFRSQVNRINSQSSALIASIDSQLTNTNLSSSERTKLENQKAALIQKRDENLAKVNESMQARISELQTERSEKQVTIKTSQENLVKITKNEAAAINNIVSEYKNVEDQIGKFEKQEGAIQREINLVEQAIRSSGWRSQVDSYLGGSPVSGKGYADLASLLGQTRSSIYTGEAMTKMRQNADILVDENGSPIEFTTKFGSGSHSYEEMASIKQKLASHEIGETELRKLGFANSGIFQSAFEDIEKQAASAYISANIAMIDDKVASNVKYRLKRPELNSAVLEMWNTFADELVKSGVPASEVGRLLNDFKKNPGDFMAKASGEKDTYSSVGKKVVDTQRPSDGGK